MSTDGIMSEMITGDEPTGKPLMSTKGSTIGASVVPGAGTAGGASEKESPEGPASGGEEERGGGSSVGEREEEMMGEDDSDSDEFDEAEVEMKTQYCTV